MELDESSPGQELRRTEIASIIESFFKDRVAGSNISLSEHPRCSTRIDENIVSFDATFSRIDNNPLEPNVVIRSQSGSSHSGTDDEEIPDELLIDIDTNLDDIEMSGLIFNYDVNAISFTPRTETDDDNILHKLLVEPDDIEMSEYRKKTWLERQEAHSEIVVIKTYKKRIVKWKDPCLSQILYPEQDLNITEIQIPTDEMKRQRGFAAKQKELAAFFEVYYKPSKVNLEKDPNKFDETDREFFV